MTDESKQAFDRWLRSVCFQATTKEAYDLAWEAWQTAVTESVELVVIAEVSYSNWNGMTIRVVDGAPILPIGSKLYAKPTAAEDGMVMVPVEPTYCEQIVELLLEFEWNMEIGWNHKKDGTLYAFMLCNDLFCWGCADGEEILLSDLPDIRQACEESEEHGGLLWCARKRKMRPQGAYYKHFGKDAALFDACGPRRETGMGNPQDQDKAMLEAAKGAK